MNPYSFVHKLNNIRDFSDFLWFFDHQPIEAKIFIGAAIFGCLVLVYIFIVAIFIDKQI